MQGLHNNRKLCGQIMRAMG